MLLLLFSHHFNYYYLFYYYSFSTYFNDSLCLVSRVIKLLRSSRELRINVVKVKKIQRGSLLDSCIAPTSCVDVVLPTLTIFSFHMQKKD
jgi:hypothetical protein